MLFEDRFSRLAAAYSRYRPGHPPELFDFLASIAPGHHLAWDCGTGNGQAAVELARHFRRVFATDASAGQVAEARGHDRVEYAVERAESVSLMDSSVDLVTVAVAVHWFDLERFYAEVARVLRPGGVLAVWTYFLPLIDPAVYDVLYRYYSEVLRGHWPDGIAAYVETQYRTLPFPFEEIRAPDFSVRLDWDLGQLAGFLGSWSATQRYIEHEGSNPLEIIWADLERAWGDPVLRRTGSYPLYVRVGRKTDR